MIPVVVHLFNFRRAKKLYFSSIKFIGRVSTEAKSRTRLKHYLILSSRILIFLAISGVVYQFLRLNESVPQRSYFFYLDNSISQSIERNGSISLNRSRARIEELLLTNSESLFLSNEFSPFSNSLKKEDELLNELNSINYTYYQRPLSSILNRVRDSDLQNIIYFSDMQGLQNEDFHDLAIDSTRSYALVISDLSGNRNAAVDTAFLSYNPSDNINMILNLEIGFSKEFIEGNVVVRLMSNGRQLSSLTKKVTEIGKVIFDIPSSFNQLFEVQISGDDIEYDNSFFISIGMGEKPKVVLISSEENIYLNTIFGNTSLFEFSRMSPDQINFSVLESSDLIIFNNLVTMPREVVDQLSRPKIVVFPADSIDYKSYEMTLGIGMYNSEDSEVYESIFDFEKPFFSKFLKKIEINNLMPYGTSVHEFKGVFERIVGLRNDRPLMIRTVNDIYVLSSPLKEEYTNLATHALFLPIMYQLAQQSVEEEDLDLYYYPNQIISLENNFVEVPIKITNSNFEVVPEFTHSNGLIAFRIPIITPPGFYHLMQGADTLANISVNLSKSESNMEGLTVAELTDFFKNSSNVSVVGMNEEMLPSHLMNSELSSLWKYILVLIILLIFTETMLHRYLK